MKTTVNSNIKAGDRYLIKLSIKEDVFMNSLWHYSESAPTLKGAKRLCESLFDKTVHEMQIVDLVTDKIVKTWKN